MFYTTIQLSQNQKKTPEGFLVCLGCAIARTGFQLYNELEVPSCAPGPDGMIKVDRSDAEVFSADTIASAEGKDIVIDHPPVDVMPNNWRELSHGHMQNVRRGTGVEDHLLLADLLFKTPEIIAMIEANPNSQLSCGYDARYKVHGPGHAEQCDIRINHVAVVEAARCGPTCATRDAVSMRTIDLWTTAKTDSEKSDILHGCGCQVDNCGCAKTQRTGDAAMAGWIDRIKDAFKAKDEKAFGEAVRDAEQHMAEPVKDEHHIHLHIGGHGPETTKPAGDLPETGEERVTSAADAHQVGGEHAATFGGHAFFADAATNDLFHGHMRNLDNSIMGMHGEMGKMKDTLESINKKLEAKTEDAVAGEEAAKEKANKEIEGELKEEAPPGTGDSVTKARDSVMLGDSFKKTCEDAECLVPGIGLPTFDSAAAPVDGYKVICGIRRKALVAFSATKDGEKALSEVTQVRDFAGCSCKDITGAFRAAVAMQKTRNSDMQVRSFNDSEVVRAELPKPFTLADWQAAIDRHNAAEDARTAE